ncbi:MAG TPA: GAF domain-containing protein, partial [Blastocatellia bacterium]|nr:GAF domain-containing protein [Blastocatellia bacterium]
MISEVTILRQRVAELEAADRRIKGVLSQKTAFIELLKVVATSAQEGATIENVMQICLEQICTRLGWPIGHIYQVTPESAPETISTDLWYLADPERFAAFRQATDQLRSIEGQGLPGQVIAARKPIWIADVAQAPNFLRAEPARKIGLKTGFGLPVLIRGEVTAVLEFFSTDHFEMD